MTASCSPPPACTTVAANSARGCAPRTCLTRDKQRTAAILMISKQHTCVSLATGEHASTGAMCKLVQVRAAPLVSSLGPSTLPIRQKPLDSSLPCRVKPTTANLLVLCQSHSALHSKLFAWVDRQGPHLIATAIHCTVVQSSAPRGFMDPRHLVARRVGALGEPAPLV
jgi:hypothetical protein